jgi:hypothetical protein
MAGNLSIRDIVRDRQSREDALREADTAFGIQWKRVHRPRPRAHTRGFPTILREVQKLTDCMVEQGEFELPVQICKQSDDSIKSTYQSNKECHKRTNAGVLSIDL